MIAGFLLALREGLEAALVIGVALGSVRRMGRPELRGWIWAGSAVAAALSLMLGLSLNLLRSGFEGPAEEAFEGITALLAAGLLSWMILWMQSQQRSIRSGLEANVQRSVARSRGWGLFLLALISVLREGIEAGIFLTAAAMASGSNDAFLGGMLGLVTASVFGALLFATTVRLNLRQFFALTSAILILFAAGLVSLGVHALSEAGWIPALLSPVWNTSSVLNEGSTVGQVLHALFGYRAEPSLAEILGYVSYFGLMVLALRWATEDRKRREDHRVVLPRGSPDDPPSEGEVHI